jgi:hypothetical protein
VRELYRTPIGFAARRQHDRRVGVEGGRDRGGDGPINRRGRRDPLDVVCGSQKPACPVADNRRAAEGLSTGGIRGRVRARHPVASPMRILITHESQATRPKGRFDPNGKHSGGIPRVRPAADASSLVPRQRAGSDARTRSLVRCDRDRRVEAQPCRLRSRPRDHSGDVVSRWTVDTGRTTAMCQRLPPSPLIISDPRKSCCSS